VCWANAIIKQFDPRFGTWTSKRVVGMLVATDRLVLALPKGALANASSNTAQSPKCRLVSTSVRSLIPGDTNRSCQSLKFKST
jgi:hypothetical protein